MPIKLFRPSSPRRIVLNLSKCLSPPPNGTDTEILVNPPGNNQYLCGGWEKYRPGDAAGCPTHKWYCCDQRGQTREPRHSQGKLLVSETAGQSVSFTCHSDDCIKNNSLKQLNLSTQQYCHGYSWGSFLHF